MGLPSWPMRVVKWAMGVLQKANGVAQLTNESITSPYAKPLYVVLMRPPSGNLAAIQDSALVVNWKSVLVVNWTSSCGGIQLWQGFWWYWAMYRGSCPPYRACGGGKVGGGAVIFVPFGVHSCAQDASSSGGLVYDPPRWRYPKNGTRPYIYIYIYITPNLD